MDFAANYHSAEYRNGNIKLEELSVSPLSDCYAVKFALAKREQEASRIDKVGGEIQQRDPDLLSQLSKLNIFPAYLRTRTCSGALCSE